jgi:hypothetical protein
MRLDAAKIGNGRKERGPIVNDRPSLKNLFRGLLQYNLLNLEHIVGAYFEEVNSVSQVA